MKYCRSCKLRAKDSDTVCATCGQPLATFGAAPVATTAPRVAGVRIEPALTLQGQIQQLHVAQKRNTRRSWLLALVCAVVLLAVLVTLYSIYDATVLSYAVLENVKIEQNPTYENMIKVSYDVVKPGKVVYDRRSGNHRTEKVNLLARKDHHEESWAWPSDARTGIDFAVLSRAWLTRDTLQKHFNLAGKKGGAIDVVFLLDITGSMRPYIDPLKKKCSDFANLVEQRGADCHLGLLAFGDVDMRPPEPFFPFPPTDDLVQFQKKVSGLPQLDGGDEPESTVEALREALKMKTRPNAKVFFVHITDASCHHREQLPEVAATLKERGITTYVVSQKQWQNWYNLLCTNDGRFFAIEEADFGSILDNVAQSIGNSIELSK